MNILITGGAGSLGTAILKEISSYSTDNITVRVFDNNEHALSKIRYEFVRKTYGSITDIDRLDYAMRDIDVCIHCAAMKNIDITEYNPGQVIKINVIGTDNVAMSAIKNNVKRVLFISSDKAVGPINLYGASKLIGEYTILRHNETQLYTKLSVLRSGNFTESNGAVKEIWANQLKNNEPLTITSMNCVRYYITLEAVSCEVMDLIKYMNGGEIFIPHESLLKPKSVRTLLKETYSDDNVPDFEVIGLRSGEKLSERLYSDIESNSLEKFEHGNCYVIR